MQETIKIIVEIPADYTPEDGDALDMVTAALNHFYVPAYVYQAEEKGEGSTC
jgi:hypothetical protein